MKIFSQDKIIETTKRRMLNVYPHSLGIVFERGKGSFIWDKAGKKYLDFAAGIGVNILGHSHPAVIEAVKLQLEKEIHAGNLYYSEPQARLAELLCSVTGFDRVFFSNSGAEANEAAFKTARRWGASQTPRREGIISFTDGWHGRTIAAISASGASEMQRGFDPLLSGFKHVKTFNLDEVKKALTERTIGLFIEPVPGHGGVLPAPEGFLRDVREICSKKGALLIMDEVQTGLGRTGEFLRCHGEKIKPDMVSLAKGLAGGLPVGATLFTEETAKLMDVGSHGTTFGGNPVACAAACEVVNIISKPQFLNDVRTKACHLLNGLKGLQDKFPQTIREVRGVGLMCALAVNGDRNELACTFAAKGLVSTTMKPDCVRFLPPLTVSRSEIDDGLSILEDALSVYENTL